MLDEDDPQFERHAEGASRIADLIESATKKKKQRSKRKAGNKK